MAPAWGDGPSGASAGARRSQRSGRCSPRTSRHPRLSGGKGPWRAPLADVVNGRLGGVVADLDDVGEHVEVPALLLHLLLQGEVLSAEPVTVLGHLPLEEQEILGA